MVSMSKWKIKYMNFLLPNAHLLRRIFLMDTKRTVFFKNMKAELISKLLDTLIQTNRIAHMHLLSVLTVRWWCYQNQSL